MTTLTFCGILLGLAATPAKAVTADVTCGGADSLTISPGLLHTEQKVTVTARHSYEPCESSDPTLKSGSDGGTVSFTVSCETFDNPGSGTLTIKWNNGQTSTFPHNRTATHAGGKTEVVFTGTITDGEFKGETAVLTITEDTLNSAACDAPPGVSSSSGVMELSIVRAF